METSIIKTPQMLQGNSSMPMNEGDKSVQGNSKNMPFTAHTFPNAENIRPPRTEERRVVEPSTRAAVILKKYQETQFMWQEYISKIQNKTFAERAYLREKFALMLKNRNSLIDIKV